jgi:hypothetical protein
MLYNEKLGDYVHKEYDPYEINNEDINKFPNTFINIVNAIKSDLLWYKNDKGVIVGCMKGGFIFKHIMFYICGDSAQIRQNDTIYLFSSNENLFYVVFDPNNTM